MCHVLHYSCNVNAAVADGLHCRMICGTVPFLVHAWMPPATAATWSPAAAHSKSLSQRYLWLIPRISWVSSFDNHLIRCTSVVTFISLTLHKVHWQCYWNVTEISTFWYYTVGQKTAPFYFCSNFAKRFTVK